MFKNIASFIDANLRGYGVKVVDPADVAAMVLDPGFGAKQEAAYGDIASITDTYEKVSWVYTCVAKIANNIARLPIKVYQIQKDETKVDITNNPDFYVLNYPNKYQTKFDFWVESISRLLLQGEMFWELDRGETGEGKINSVFADWRSENVRVIGTQEELIAGYKRYSNGKWYNYRPSEVFYIRIFNPSSVHRGMAPLRSGRDVLTLDLNAMAFNKNFFKQGLKPSGVLEISEAIRNPKDEELKRAKEKFEELYKGVERMHSVAVTWGGTKFVPLNSMSLSDVEFSELRNMNREEIAAIFGVPLEILGVGKKTYENVKEARRGFWEETINPLLLKIYSLMNVMFLPILTKRTDVVVQPDLSGIEALKEDRDLKAKRYFEAFKSAAATPNDIREDVLGKDPLDEPAMNSTYLPMSLIPAAEISEVPQKGVKKKVIPTRDELSYGKLLHGG